MSSYNKDPGATLDYGFDWGTKGWLKDEEKIVSSTWTVPPGIINNLDSFTDTQTVIWLSGGSADQDYSLVNHITTDQGRSDERTLLIKVRNR